MVRSHRRRASRLGLLAGMFMLAIAAGMLIAAGVLAWLAVISLTTAIMALAVPGLALAALAGLVWWLAVVGRRSLPPAQVRWDEQFAATRPGRNARYMGRAPVADRNQVPAMFRERS